MKHPDNFKGAPPEWMQLMTEVFDAWASDRKQSQQQLQHLSHQKPQHQPNMQPSPYTPPQQHQPNQQYTQPQPYPQSQQYPQSPPYPQSQPLYPANSQQLPPMSPPLTPGTPLPLYTSPMMHNAVPTAAYGYMAPQGGAIEMPAELPANVLLSAPTPVLARSASTEVSLTALYAIQAPRLTFRRNERVYSRSCFEPISNSSALTHA